MGYYFVFEQFSGQPSEPREDILNDEGEREKAGETKNWSNGADRRNNLSQNSQGESLKNGEPMEPQPSEENRLHTKQILEKSRPEPPLESWERFWVTVLLPCVRSLQTDAECVGGPVMWYHWLEASALTARKGFNPQQSKATTFIWLYYSALTT